MNNGWVRSDRDGSLDVDHRVVLMSDHHFDDGGRGQRTPILREREKMKRKRRDKGDTYFITETTHSGSERVLDDLQGVVSIGD